VSLRKEIVSKQLKVIDLLQQKTDQGDLVWEYLSQCFMGRGKFTGFKTAFFLNGNKVTAKVSDYNFRIILDFGTVVGSFKPNQILMNGPEFRQKAMVLLRTVRDKFHPTASKLDDLIETLEQGTFKNEQLSKLAANKKAKGQSSVNHPLPLDGQRAIDLGDDE